MKSIFISTALYIFMLLSCEIATAQTLEWARKIGGSGDDRGKAIALDKNANIYTIGSFTGTADFAPLVGVFNLTSQGGKDIFISKLDVHGNFVWAKNIGGQFNDVGYSIALDSANNAYICGFFSDTVDFDPNAGVFNLVASGERSVFVCKLDSNGNFVWAKSFNNQTNSTNYYSHPYMALDANANVYISDAFWGTVDMDPDTSVFNLTNGGVFICKLNTLGQFIWAKRVPLHENYGISVDIQHDIYITGNFGGVGTVDVDPGIGIFNLTASTYYAFYILKLNSIGNFEWAKVVDAGFPTYSNAMALDSANNVFITGFFRDTVDFNPDGGGFNLVSISSTSTDIFILKLNALGNFVWAKSIGGQSSDYGYGITLDAAGNVYTTGYFFGTADFDPNVGVFNLTNPTGGTFFSKLDNAGNFIWAKTVQGTGLNETYGIVVDSNDDVYTIGVFSTTVDFDPNAGVYNLTATGNSADIFIHKMSQPLPTPITKTETPLPITLYPNPSNGILQLEIAQDFRIANIEIINTLGQVLARTQTSDRNSRLVLPDAVGIYFVRVEVEGKVGVYRVVRE